MSRPSASTTGRYFDESAGFLKKKNLKYIKGFYSILKLFPMSTIFLCPEALRGPEKRI